MSRTKRHCQSRLEIEHQGSLRRVTIRTGTRTISKMICLACRQAIHLPDRDVTLTPGRSNPK